MDFKFFIFLSFVEFLKISFSVLFNIFCFSNCFILAKLISSFNVSINESEFNVNTLKLSSKFKIGSFIIS